MFEELVKKGRKAATLSSLPSDIDGLVEELERGLEGVTPGEWSSFYKAKYDEWHVSLPMAGSSMKLALCPDGIQAEDREAVANWIALCCSPDNIRKLIAALRARQAPEGVVDDIKAAMSAAIWNDFLYDIDKMVYGEGSRLPDQNDATKLAEIAYRAALSAMPSGAVKVTDGLSEWQGWDQSREPWGETKHKDAVLEALFRGPWSVEDAATLIGFIDRTWTKRPGQPS